ncbi:MAG TPA: hypothetical protein VHN17_10005 [Steroidobacteraceae bacterium]|jgi:hypothetical protein|nr:hypothetical protein [Steroidobacteraceae bacterium]
MISRIPATTSAPRLTFISAGLLVLAHGALAAAPVSDAQTQARQFILAEPAAGATTDSTVKTAMARSAHGIVRVDPQEQARQFILARPTFGGFAGRVVLPVPKTRDTSDLSALSNPGARSNSL